MADEISYEIMGVQGTNIIVKYTLLGHSVDLMLSLDPATDVGEQIKRMAPRRLLVGMQHPQIDLSKLVGLTGSADLEQPPVPLPPVEEPAEAEDEVTLEAKAEA